MTALFHMQPQKLLLLIEITQMNRLEIQSGCAILIYSAVQKLKKTSHLIAKLYKTDLGIKGNFVREKFCLVAK